MCFQVKVFCEIDSSNFENNYDLKCVKFYIFIINYYAFYLLGKFIFYSLFIFQGVSTRVLPVSTRVVSAIPGSHCII